MSTLRAKVIEYLTDQRDLAGAYEFPDIDEMADAIICMVLESTCAKITTTLTAMNEERLDKRDESREKGNGSINALERTARLDGEAYGIRSARTAVGDLYRSHHGEESCPCPNHPATT